MQRNKNKGFTLIELLVVVAIIALLSSIALIALMSARQKSRDAARIADMTQMNTALALYFNTYVGYPSSTTGLPSAIIPQFANSLPSAPQPPDGSCGGITYPDPVPSSVNGGDFYYLPSGTPYLAADNITTVYPDYGYYFCLGATTGNYSAGMHILTPTGVR